VEGMVVGGGDERKKDGGVMGCGGRGEISWGRKEGWW
jgi:hypothetical protein